MSKHYIRVSFPFNKVPLHKLVKIEEMLEDIGITFDTGASGNERDWEWDWSLKGPINIEIYHEGTWEEK